MGAHLDPTDSNFYLNNNELTKNKFSASLQRGRNVKFMVCQLHSFAHANRVLSISVCTSAASLRGFVRACFLNNKEKAQDIEANDDDHQTRPCRRASCTLNQISAKLGRTEALSSRVNSNGKS